MCRRTPLFSPLLHSPRRGRPGRASCIDQRRKLPRIVLDLQRPTSGNVGYVGTLHALWHPTNEEWKTDRNPRASSADSPATLRFFKSSAKVAGVEILVGVPAGEEAFCRRVPLGKSLTVATKHAYLHRTCCSCPLPRENFPAY